MPYERIQDRCQVFFNCWNMKNIGSIRFKTIFAFIDDDDRGCFVCFEYGCILDNITDDSAS